MNLLKFLLKESRTRIIVVTVCGLLSSFSMALFVRTVHRVIDPNLSADGFLVFHFIAASLLFVSANLGGHIPLLKLTEHAVFRLRLQMIHNILATKYRNIEEIGSARLYASLTDDVGRLVSGLAIVPGAMINLAMLLGGFTYLVLLAWKVLLGLIPFIFLLVLLFKITNSTATKRFTAARETGDLLFHHLRTVTGGIKELKIHAGRRRRFVSDQLEPDSASYRDYRVKGLAAYEYANAIMALGFMSIIGVLLFGLPRWIGTDHTVLSGTVLVFMFMLTPLTKTFELLGAVAEANVALKKMDSLGLTLQQHEEHESATAGQERSWDRLKLEGVSHTYYNEREDEQFTLGPVDLTVNRGEILFITGGNGSGKSTLAKLITALYEPEQGGIRLDDHPITDANREWYRQFFSTIYSDYFLFDQFLGIEDPALQENVAHYLSALHLDHKVKLVDGNRLSTTNLSSGQKKRLALLIAYLEDRPIYLFDEWASDQDPQFKQTFYTEILPELKRRGKGVVVITHDDRYFDTADRMVKLGDGQMYDVPLRHQEERS